MNLRLFAWTLLLALLLSSAWWLINRPPQALLITGGPIITMAEPAQVEALLVRDGRIAGLGDYETLRLKSADAQHIDLQGATLMPGLIEPHTHPLASALLGQTVDISGFKHSDRAAVISTLRKAANGFAWPKWVVAFGWDPVMLDDLEPPTLAELDSISPDRPLLILTQMMHDAFLNSAALSAAGITADTPNPPGAEFVKDAHGKLTGTVREVRAIEQVLAAMPPVPNGVPALLLNRQYARYAQSGFTTLGVLGPVGRAQDPIGLMHGLAENKNVAVRTVVYGLPEQLRDPRWVAGLSSGEERFILRGAKFWLDGSPWTGGAAWKEAYADTSFTRERLHLPANHSGTLHYSNSALAALFEEFHQQGYQIAMHAQGERAIHQAHQVASRVLARHPRADHRHRLEHSALISRQQLKDTQQSGLTASFFIDHLRFYGHRLPDLVGADRAARFMPMASAFRTGHKASLHTDNPATPIAPFRAIQTAILRQSQRTGQVIGPNERIDIQQALRAVTVNAAWQLGIEKERGSLEIGKDADLVMLSINPLTTAPERLTDIEVLGTWIAGQAVNTHWLTWQNIKLTGQAAASAIGL